MRFGQSTQQRTAAKRYLVKRCLSRRLVSKCYYQDYNMLSIQERPSLER
jgi:hypothetical protein